MSDELKNKILRNKRAIFDTEASVQFNVAQVQVSRSVIEENLTDAQQSYLISAAGNRELIMRTTDDVFRNRLALIEQLSPEGKDQESFKLSMANRVKVEYLEHRAKINRKMVKINNQMADAIASLGDVTQKFFELNEEMVNYIDEVSDSNGQWQDGELKGMMDSVLPAANESRVNEIAEVVAGIKNAASETRNLINQSFERGSELKEKLNDLQDDGNEMREGVISLREKVDANQKRVSEKIQG
tara:strand:+ start:254 stop:982 length:729 start_codon:yes stop_codon:yes gene_type:complete